MRAELNRKLTLSGSGTPAGQLMRQYWQPAALSRELESIHPVRPVNLLGEKLVLFRDDSGNLGLIDRHCAHRGADLCYGRIENGGIRCPFHGWLFDTNGNCLQQPAEPSGSNQHHRIQQNSYSVIEKNGIIFAFMGEGPPPTLPALDCFIAPGEFTFAFKGFLECNWLQALEVGIDPAHASFLHRFINDETAEQSYGKQFRDSVDNSELTGTQLLREYNQPKIEAVTTEFGVRLTALRTMHDQRIHLRITNQLFPNAIVIPMSREMSITQWHVPIDDTHCYWYAIFTSYDSPVDQNKMLQQRLELYELPDYRPRLNKRNQYGYDPYEQQTKTYTGMGEDINVHDQWAVESQGPIQDRTREHLARSDCGIIAYRRLLEQSIDHSDPTLNLPLYGAELSPSSEQFPYPVDAIVTDPSQISSWLEIATSHRNRAPWISSSE
ncbi:MAG: phthalate 4,5-dioxygenase oxygenase subunit [Gammaproteobacteria bacterium]|jgi:phthalate 4,5-dioxygenase oxygenase subunit